MMKDKYTQERKLALAHIYDTDGLQVILDLMDDACVESENELIGTNPSNRDEVAGAQAVCYAQRKFFQTVVHNLDTLVASAKNTPVENVEQQREKDEERAALLSALPSTEIN